MTLFLSSITSITSPSRRIRMNTMKRILRPAATSALRLTHSKKSFSRLASHPTRPHSESTKTIRIKPPSGGVHTQTLFPLRDFSSSSSSSPPPPTSPPNETSVDNTNQQSPHYFRKVLIANRGEISIRVARTCRRLGIPTVAVYVSNDSGSKHVTEADEAVCLGSDGTAYTDLQALLEAIRVTGADAVHPGYGFLSENADFANAVQELEIDCGRKTVQWLGPPAQAIVDMGCKLRSKEIAKEAGVAIIPGCDDGALDSVEEALELMNNNSTSSINGGLEYPVLLKAAAGGGGKGMRICWNDRELIEGYPLAMSEGLKFFADGRLLLEQYLENPHHIEFQVICSKREAHNGNGSDTAAVDVAIFAERECSIQRRNQKVVEESPSCLLTEDTRLQMMEQTALLCQNVGYEGAGTVEWLVVDATTDNNTNNNEGEASQKFFFLEMNTRLQVEHPITEAVSYNVDLVEAMLEVGSGRGLPKEWYETATVVETASDYNNGKMLIMPWKGHSIEGRIYAEDPHRGYLPSTGPLVPYKEPLQARSVDDGSNCTKTSTESESSVSSSYLRLDSGVVEGHVVTPFYDPMLSKIVSYAPTRKEAIQILSDGLDSYVIEGLQHNAKLVQAVLRHPSFQSGKTPTSFLEDEIPDFSEYKYSKEGNDPDNNNEEGSKGSLLSASEEEELAVAVAVISKTRETLLGRPPVVGGSTGDDSNTAVIRLDGIFGNADAFSVTIVNEANEAHVCRMGNESIGNRIIALGGVALDLERYLARVTLDGTERTIQVLNERQSGELKIQMHGAEYSNCLVQSPREYELSRHMLPPVLEDMSDIVMSPMPGTLISFSGGVSVGDSVTEGQDLCVVEAMKMQNIIRAPREGIVSKICVEEGAALVTDQIILEFETEETEEEHISVA